MIHDQCIRRRGRNALAALVLGVASAWGLAAHAAEISVTLSGAQEVPPVNTTARGSVVVKINDDGSVNGSVYTSAVMGTAAHIHSGAAGMNGPVVLPLTKGADGTWSVPDGAKLTPAQLGMFKSGELYVNVHSAAHPDGEIRGQLK